MPSFWEASSQKPNTCYIFSFQHVGHTATPNETNLPKSYYCLVFLVTTNICSHLDVRYEDEAKVCQGEEDVEWQRGDLSSELISFSFSFFSLLCSYIVYGKYSKVSLVITLHCAALTYYCLSYCIVYTV